MAKIHLSLTELEAGAVYDALSEALVRPMPKLFAGSRRTALERAKGNLYYAIRKYERGGEGRSVERD